MSAALIPDASPALRGFLAERRDELNARFARAQQRFAKLDPEVALLQLAEILPPLAGDEQGAARLLSSVYDLVLLHVGRDALTRHPGLATLLRETARVPTMRKLLLADPDRLPAELSNAIENLGKAGAQFATELRLLAARADSPAALRLAGATLAWRLGEARLRATALAALDTLDPALWLAGLGIEAAPKRAIHVRDELRHEGWRRPTGEDLALTRGPAQYEVVARLGEFTGFGGAFDRPPELVVTDADDPNDRHHVHVRVEQTVFRVEADVFGASIRPANPATLGAVRPALSPARFGSTPSPFCLTTQGELVRDGVTTTIPELRHATGYLGRERLVVVALADSHRLRVLAPRRDPA